MDEAVKRKMTRRCFLKQGIVGVGAVTVGGAVAFPQLWPSRVFALPDLPRATMAVMQNPALCAGCRRCEDGR